MYAKYHFAKIKTKKETSYYLFGNTQLFDGVTVSIAERVCADSYVGVEDLEVVNITQKRDLELWIFHLA